MKSDEAIKSMPVEDEWPEGRQPPFCESQDQAGLEMCLKNWNSAVCEGVGYDVSELNVYAELSPGTDFDPKQLESLKKEV